MKDRPPVQASLGPPAAPPRAPNRLLLVRHGPTQWNEAGRYQGVSDPELSDTGRRKARLLKRALEADLRLGHGGPTWCSDLRRAVATSRILFPGEPVAFDPRLRELSFGAFEGRTHHENLARSPETYGRWLEDPAAHPPPGGEDLAAFRRRVSCWLAEAAATAPAGALVRAVTHGGVVRMAAAILQGSSFGDALHPEGPVAPPQPGEGVLLDAGRATPVRPHHPSSTGAKDAP